MAALLWRHRKLAILWTLSLLVVGGISFSAQAQPGRGAPPGLPPSVITESPTIVSGPDIGFRIERTRDGIPIGKVVVRVDGRWIDTEMAASSVQPR
jgi:hypothetical protein